MFILSRFTAPVNTTDKVLTILYGLFPCLGLSIFYFFLQSFVEISYAETYFTYRYYLLRRHRINVSECLWYEEVDGNLRITLKNKRTVLLSGTVASVLFEKNKVEKLNIGLIATICKSLFWHMYFEPGKNSFVYQPSLFRKITVYYSDCEWYSIGNVHLKLKTKERTIRVCIPDVMRIDVLVMMLVINGVEER